MTIRHTESSPPPRPAALNPGERSSSIIEPRAPAGACLYLIVDPRDRVSCGDDLNRVRAAFRGGVQWAQLRMKGARVGEVIRGWERLLPLAREAGVRLIMNDHVEAAVEVGADGVHLGQSDLRRTGWSIEALHREVGEKMQVGVSTHSAAEARDALAAGADYIGFGAMFPTQSKDAALVIGPQCLDSLADLREQLDIPVFAIGGIRLENVAEITSRGVCRIAVSAAILSATDPECAARAFRSALSVGAGMTSVDPSRCEPGSTRRGAS